MRETIDSWSEALKRASGKDAFTIKKALIEMRKDQYTIKQAYLRPIIFNKFNRTSTGYIRLDDKSELDENGDVVIAGVTLMDPAIVSAILCNYSKLKQDSCDKFDGDTWYLIQAFE